MRPQTEPQSALAAVLGAPTAARPEPPEVRLLQLAKRVSGRDDRHSAGWLGKARLVASLGEARHGNPPWDVYASEPELRGEREARDGG